MDNTDFCKSSNRLGSVNFYQLKVAKISFDCVIEKLRFDLTTWEAPPLEIIFGPHATVKEFVVDEHGIPKMGALETVRITNGVGAGNATTLLKAAERLKKAELLFTNASDDDWRGMLTAIRKDYQVEVHCPECPAAIRAEFSDLVFVPSDH